MRRIGNTACFLSAESTHAIQYLEYNPQSEHDHSWHRKQKETKEYIHSSGGIEEYICTQHSGDCARGAKTRHQHIMTECCFRKYVRERSDNANDEIEEEISQMPKPVFNIVTKDPQVKHVSAEVCKSSMHEHGSNERKPHGYVCDAQAWQKKFFSAYWINNCSSMRDDILSGENFSRHR